MAAIRALTAAVAASPWVGFDLEFASSDRYWPELCLLQISLADHPSWDAALAPFVAHVAIPAARQGVSAGRQAIVLVETKALALPLGPNMERSSMQFTDARRALVDLVAALGRHPCAIAHAPRQDLAILTANAGVEFGSVFDTQTAAAFCGIGDQVGYARLVDEVMGAQLSKEHQWTDWRRRPLSVAQLGYAADDVRYLYPMYLALQARLGEREAWSAEEAQGIIAAATAAVRVSPHEAWRDVGGIRGLTAVAARFVMATAAWRLATARLSNRPISHVLDDVALVDFAKRCGQWRGDGIVDEFLLSTMNHAKIPSGHRDTLLVEMAAAIADKHRVIPSELLRPDTGPPHARGGTASGMVGRAAKWAEQLLLIAAVTAEDFGIAVRLLATRGDAEAFARLADEGRPLESHAALATWRVASLGHRWREWLAGRGSLIADRTAALGLKWHSLVAPAGMAPVDAVGKASAGKASAGKASAGKASAGKASAGKASAGK
ncbi:MAG: hypothetical protein KBG15_21495, partial [Kofleriaceae bacterium]|nr:hypothetical protein [Kofleriaceae bacterium]